MTARRKGKTVSLTGPLLEGFMLIKGYGASVTQPMNEENTAKIVLTMIHLALVEKDQQRALAIVKGLVSAARSGRRTADLIAGVPCDEHGMPGCECASIPEGGD